MAQTEPQPERVSRSTEVGKQGTPVVNQGLYDLLTSWMEDDDEENIAEQRETREYLERVLDEDRLSDRKLFR